MYSACREPLCRTVNLIKILSNTRRKRLRCASESTLRNSIRLLSTGSGPEHVEGSLPQAAVFRSRLQRDSLVLKSIKRSVINIRCSTFNLLAVPARGVSYKVSGFKNSEVGMRKIKNGAGRMQAI